MKHLLLLAAFTLGCGASFAQSPLNKTVTVNADRQPLAIVLDNISMQGGFHFSYVKEFIHDDSLVTVHVNEKSVKQVLDILFLGNFHFREIGNQIIIQPGTSAKEKWYVVSGHVKDAITGAPVNNASVYERVQLISTMTNEHGYFRIRLREREKVAAATLTVSKDLYRDTIMFISSGFDQEINATIKPAPPIMLSVVDVNQHSHVEQTLFGRFFLSSRQRMQSLNLSDFFTKQPYQYSLVPAIGTHGRIGSQVINKFSLNLIGGYTAGLNGVELAGVFNIDQKDVKWVQAAGVFNIVGGHMTGAQLAGIHNHTLDSLEGVQAAGVSNVLKNGFDGAQLSGVYSQAGGLSKGAQLSGAVSFLGQNIEGVQASGAIGVALGKVSGAQLAGAVNYSRNIKGTQLAGAVNVSTDSLQGVQLAGAINYAKRVKGVQAAGAVNVSTDTVAGGQLAGLVNYARVLKGFQLGVFNYADSSDGYSIGVLSFVRKGYHQIQVYSNEVLDLNIAYKSGNRKLYSLLIGGMSLGNKKAYSAGYGVGHDFRLSAASFLSTEITSQLLYLGSWKATNSLLRLQTAWNRRLMKNISFFAGPAFTIYYVDTPDQQYPAYQSKVPRHYSPFTISSGVNAWFGWHIGIGFL